MIYRTMRHLRTYQLFESIRSLSGNQREFLDKYTKGTWSLNPTTGEVDVDEDFDCSVSRLQSFNGIKFGKVSGSFKCTRNLITSLEGCPHTVGEDFDCSYNKLTSLVGAPKIIGGEFRCIGNDLQSLEGAPQTVGGDFHCSRSGLITLEGGPKTVGGTFNCSDNYIRNLKGAPETVGGDFLWLRGSDPGASLEGAPETIKGEFVTSDWQVPAGKWSIGTLMDIFFTGTPVEKRIVSPLVDLEKIQQQVDENPEKMLVNLKDHLKNPYLQGLKWPQHLDREKGLLSDLGDVGL